MKINDFCTFSSKNWSLLSILEYVRIVLESDMYCTTEKGTQQNKRNGEKYGKLLSKSQTPDWIFLPQAFLFWYGFAQVKTN